MTTRTHMRDIQPVKMAAADSADSQLAYAFAPIHKLALGVASGIVAGGMLLFITLVALTINHGDGSRALYLGLLENYFAGYSVSIGGAFIGLLWGFVVGFVTGFFCAFVRNLTIGIVIFVLRTKAELTQTTDFLDHI
jgi:hypothetical protein